MTTTTARRSGDTTTWTTGREAELEATVARLTAVVRLAYEAMTLEGLQYGPVREDLRARLARELGLPGGS